jgi:hypothetical protein
LSGGARSDSTMVCGNCHIAFDKHVSLSEGFKLERVQQKWTPVLREAIKRAQIA